MNEFARASFAGCATCRCVTASSDQSRRVASPSSRGDPGAPLTPAASLRLGDRRTRSLGGCCGLFETHRCLADGLAAPCRAGTRASLSGLRISHRIGWLLCCSSYNEVGLQFILFSFKLLVGREMLRSVYAMLILPHEAHGSEKRTFFFF